MRERMVDGEGDRRCRRSSRASAVTMTGVSPSRLGGRPGAARPARLAFSDTAPRLPATSASAPAARHPAPPDPAGGYGRGRWAWRKARSYSASMSTPCQERPGAGLIAGAWASMARVAASPGISTVPATCAVRAPAERASVSGAAFCGPSSRGCEMQGAEIGQARDPGQHSLCRLVEREHGGEHIAVKGDIGAIPARAIQVGHRQMGRALILSGDLGPAHDADVDGGGPGKGFRNRDLRQVEGVQIDLDRQLRDGGRDRLVPGRRGLAPWAPSPLAAARLILSARTSSMIRLPWRSGASRSLSARPSSCAQRPSWSSSRRCATWRSVGTVPLRPSMRNAPPAWLLATFSTKRWPGAVLSAPITPPMRSEHKQHQRAERDTEPFGDAAEHPHQKACPMPI